MRRLNPCTLFPPPPPPSAQPFSPVIDRTLINTRNSQVLPPPPHPLPQCPAVFPPILGKMPPRPFLSCLTFTAVSSGFAVDRSTGKLTGDGSFSPHCLVAGFGLSCVNTDLPTPRCGPHWGSLGTLI
ncbi:hypothetical protein BaRGS_00038741 [Batillaria attramentaria]|uniref:Uncharacterized protein n=1 Tax=Batillaria attramentaria TaxID=370345 RepID=A0ABD0J4X3_9CAEN